MSAPRDFDFLAGRWSVAHRRLQRRLEGCTQWDDFTGTCELRPILDGQGNLDEKRWAQAFSIDEGKNLGNQLDHAVHAGVVTDVLVRPT